MDRRIHEKFNATVLAEAAKRFGTDMESLIELGGFESYIYEYGAATDKKILRITHEYHRKPEEISAEMEWLNFLSVKGARVAAAGKSVNGLLVEQINAGDTNFIATTIDKAPGVPPNRELWTESLFREWGKAVGELHRLSKDYIPKGTPRFQWYDEYLVKDVAMYIPEDQSAVAEKAVRIINKLKELDTDKESYGLIHTDIHQGNFFCDNGTITIFDFDDCAYKHFVSDIAIAVFYSMMSRNDFSTKEEFAKYFLYNFMEGYSCENNLGKEWLRLLPDFLKLREVILYAAICRSIDPDEPDEWCDNYIKEHKSTIENDVPVLLADII